MLINTVILFLRDALPIFVISTLVIALLKQQNIKPLWYYLAALSSIILSLVLLNTIDDISQALGGTGREWFYACFYINCYFITLLLLTKLSRVQGSFDNPSGIAIRLCASALVVTVITLNSVNFLIYITGFWQQNNVHNVLATGVILGIGICASIAVLLYFLLAFIERYYQIIHETLLIFFSVGLLVKASNLLMQIDALPAGKLLWDSHSFISENSGVGQLLTVFFGYDATPTLLQLLLYILAIVMAFSLTIISSAFLSSSRAIASRKETV